MYIGQDGHEHGMGMAWVSTRHRSIVVYPSPFLHFFLFSPLIFFFVSLSVRLLKKIVVAFLPPRFSFPFGVPYSCHPIRLSPSTPPLFSSLPFSFFLYRLGALISLWVGSLFSVFFHPLMLLLHPTIGFPSFSLLHLWR